MAKNLIDIEYCLHEYKLSQQVFRKS